MSQAIERTDVRAAPSESAALRLTYSADHGLLYVAIAKGEVADTIELEETVFVDVDAEGRPLGVELLDAADLPAFLARRGGEFVVPERVGDNSDFHVEAATDRSD